MSDSNIVIKGARMNNLRNVSLSIPATSWLLSLESLVRENLVLLSTLFLQKDSDVL